MKNLFSFVIATMMMTTLFGQNEKYIKAMEANVAKVDSNNSVEGWKELANSFERIAVAEKTQWEPYYYAAFANVVLATIVLLQTLWQIRRNN